MRYFTADWHLFHKNIITYCDRPFKNTQEMSKVILSNYRKRVKKGDDVWFLGDLTMESNQEKIAAQIENLPGNKHLVLGNHDKLRPFQYLEIGFQSVHTNTEINTEFGHYYLTHDPAFAQNKNALWLVGHIHNHWKIMKSEKINTILINVGIDVWNFFPVSEEEINELLKGG